MLSAASGFSKTSSAKYYLYGLGLYQHVEKLAKEIDREIEPFMQRLVKLKERLFHKCAPELTLSGDSEAYDKIAEKEVFWPGRASWKRF